MFDKDVMLYWVKIAEETTRNICTAKGPGAESTPSE